VTGVILRLIADDMNKVTVAAGPQTAALCLDPAPGRRLRGSRPVLIVIYWRQPDAAMRVKCSALL